MIGYLEIDEAARQAVLEMCNGSTEDLNDELVTEDKKHTTN